jgi:uncharacterized protein DUF4126
METALTIALGMGLAAACGFRVFVPLLALSLAARGGYVTLAPRFDWIMTDAALWTLAIATVLEIGAYYVPWIDNLLDSVASPAAVVAGTLVAASVLTDMEPFTRWTLALIAGGGVAGSVQGLTTVARGLSTATTGGLANPILATGEAVGAGTFALLAILVPLLAAALALLLAFWVLRRLFFRRRAPQSA